MAYMLEESFTLLKETLIQDNTNANMSQAKSITAERAVERAYRLPPENPNSYDAQSPLSYVEMVGNEKWKLSGVITVERGKIARDTTSFHQLPLKAPKDPSSIGFWNRDTYILPVPLL
ncbi:hypothetical protein NDU88_002988 [Pleurodeles waltl]|uniref:Uncharacterized protein n=1 Tax=Pleurodeles waltl TaxID=8319 RepID=A0AAV7W3Z4_PLEWA|nr:hypothetical protein NDU88_002988 [Pleurodeles waltl]